MAPCETRVCKNSFLGFLQVNSSAAVLNCQPPVSSHHHGRRPLSLGLVEFSYTDRRRLNSREFPGLCSRSGGGDGNRSSVSSEGFCENETDMPDIPEPQVVLVRRGYAQLNNCGDTDSQVRHGQASCHLTSSEQGYRYSVCIARCHAEGIQD